MEGKELTRYSPNCGGEMQLVTHVLGRYVGEALDQAYYACTCGHEIASPTPPPVRFPYPLRWRFKAFYHCSIAPILCFFLGHRWWCERWDDSLTGEFFFETYCRRCHESHPDHEG